MLKIKGVCYSIRRSAIRRFTTEISKMAVRRIGPDTARYISGCCFHGKHNRAIKSIGISKSVIKIGLAVYNRSNVIVIRLLTIEAG